MDLSNLICTLQTACKKNTLLPLGNLFLILVELPAGLLLKFISIKRKNDSMKSAPYEPLCYKELPAVPPSWHLQRGLNLNDLKTFFYRSNKFCIPHANPAQ